MTLDRIAVPLPSSEQTGRRTASFPAQLSAGRSRRRRGPDAEPAPAVRPRSMPKRPDLDRLRAQRLHPHRGRRPDRPHHALCRNGPGHLHLDPDADRRRAGGGSEPGAARARSAQRKALCQPACSAYRRPAARPRYAARLEADARGRRDGTNDADCGGGQALECRSGNLPGAKRRSHPYADRTKALLWRTRRRCRRDASSRRTSRSSGRRISGSSAHPRSVSTRQGKSTERRSMASMFGFPA